MIIRRPPALLVLGFLALIAFAIPDAEEWTPLFNGSDLSGWSVQCKPEDQSQTFWKAAGGAIQVDSIGNKKHDYVWLVTDQEFGDFELRLKFQIYKDSPGNSGVQIRSRYDPEAGWMDGPQFDIHPPTPMRSASSMMKPGKPSAGFFPPSNGATIVSPRNKPTRPSNSSTVKTSGMKCTSSPGG
ncbi:MAG: DUF1080 domain-containing protein [Bdellovibrionaceae bacterium]|nr:DUF1080 domain-containing protein [Pseudobdellovibrionaceae bacterium]